MGEELQSIENLTDVEVQQQSAEIALLDEAREAIERATTVGETKEIADRAEAVRTYAKRVTYGDLLAEYALQIKLRAERKGGLLLRQIKAGGGLPEGQPSPENGPARGPYLSDLGISKNQSSAWQKIAAIPEDEFEQAVEAAKSERDLLRIAQAREKAEKAAGAEAEVAGADTEESLSELLQVGSIFSTIVVDPPWRFMSREAMCDLEVGHLAKPDSHLYLWASNKHLREAFTLLDAWDFRYVTCLTWVIPALGSGAYWKNNTEHVLFGVRGSQPLRVDSSPTAFHAPAPEVGRPDSFYSLVEEASPGPRLDFFTTKRRPRWYAYGENGVEAPDPEE